MSVASVLTPTPSTSRHNRAGTAVAQLARLPLWKLLGVCVLANLVIACSSGSNSPDEAGENTGNNEVVTDPANADNDATPGVSENTGQQPAADGVPVESSTTELSPVELLLNEIGMAARSGIDSVHAKIISGVALDETESACVGSFDAATGQTLTELDCTSAASGLSLYDGMVELRSARLVADEACLEAISQGSSSVCRLESAALQIPVEWVPLANPAPSQIASVTPTQGANIDYNQNEDGVLRLSSASDLFVEFSCAIDLVTAQLLTDASSSGCQNQVDRIIRRLFELRTNG